MYDSGSAATGGLIAFIAAYTFIVLILAVVMIVALWKIFTKAGKPGWAAIVPIYNILVLLEIVGLPWWWLLIMIFAPLIPVVGSLVAIAVWFYITYLLGKSFGKEIGFIIGMMLLGIVFYPILAFDKSEYLGPAVKDPNKPFEPLQQEQTTKSESQPEQTQTPPPSDTTTTETDVTTDDKE